MSILFDYQGLLALLYPIIVSIVASFHLNAASYMSMTGSMLIFGQIFSGKQDFIISNRFYYYVNNFPQKKLPLGPL